MFERADTEQVERICEALFRTNSRRSILRVVIFRAPASLLSLCLGGRHLLWFRNTLRGSHISRTSANHDYKVNDASPPHTDRCGE
jgi:hypothetical protein